MTVQRQGCVDIPRSRWALTVASTLHSRLLSNREEGHYAMAGKKQLCDWEESNILLSSVVSIYYLVFILQCQTECLEVSFPLDGLS